MKLYKWVGALLLVLISEPYPGRLNRGQLVFCEGNSMMTLRLALSAVLAGVLILLIRALVLDALASRRRTRQICHAVLDALYEIYKCQFPTGNDLWLRMASDGMDRTWESTYRRQLGRLIWQGKIRRDGDTLSLSKHEFRRRAQRHGQEPGMALAVRLARRYWQEQST